MKWFAKWFGGRSQSDEADEPARFAPVETHKPVQPAADPAKIAVKASAKKQGFDPYNSGSFERRNAWERVNRR